MNDSSLDGGRAGRDRTGLDARIHRILCRGVVIPACPLALTQSRKLDERRQRALVRYYSAAGAGGLAVAVHTTQFAIRESRFGLLEPVLALAAEEMNLADARRTEPLVRIGGICGPTPQALKEAELLRRLGYHAGLVSLGGLASGASNESLAAHYAEISQVLPVVGFYLQPAAGGRQLDYEFWRRFCHLPHAVAIKIAPFNRYQTLDVIRAVAESGREDIALYTGNDDAIVLDLVTPYRFQINGRAVERRIVGGLLGHWAVWTRRAVELLDECHQRVLSGTDVPLDLLRRHGEITDANAAFFDAAHQYAGCIAGLLEVLRRQGLLAGTWCLDPNECLSPGQSAEIDRVSRAYPHLNDDDFVHSHLDEWLHD